MLWTAVRALYYHNVDQRRNSLKKGEKETEGFSPSSNGKDILLSTAQLLEYVSITLLLRTSSMDLFPHVCVIASVCVCVCAYLCVCVFNIEIQRSRLTETVGNEVQFVEFLKSFL